MESDLVLFEPEEEYFFFTNYTFIWKSEKLHLNILHLILLPRNLARC